MSPSVDPATWCFGATAVDEAPKGWRCPGCERKARKDDARGLLPEGWRCAACVRNHSPRLSTLFDPDDLAPA